MSDHILDMSYWMHTGIIGCAISRTSYRRICGAVWKLIPQPCMDPSHGLAWIHLMALHGSISWPCMDPLW